MKTQTGDAIENPITGETMVFVRMPSAAGEPLVLEMFIAPGGGPAAEHIHPGQEERLRIRRGEMTLELNGERSVLRAGDRVVIPAGMPHIWWNSGEGDLVALMEMTNGDRFAAFVSTFCGLAKAGHVDATGMPGLLQSAVTLREYRDTMVLTDIPPAVQSYGIPFLAFIGRLIGLRAEYPYPRRSRVTRGMEIWRHEEMTAA